LSELYPGEGSVDEVALDGYNWGTTQTNSTWQSFGQVFGPGLAQLATFTSRPVSIGETASTESGGNKAAWINDMFTQLQSTYPQVVGFVWFDFNKETDWRVDSSPSSLAAFSAGVHCYVTGVSMSTAGC
jgi:beta-mannanase